METVSWLLGFWKHEISSDSQNYSHWAAAHYRSRIWTFKIQAISRIFEFAAFHQPVAKAGDYLLHKWSTTVHCDLVSMLIRKQSPPHVKFTKFGWISSQEFARNCFPMRVPGFLPLSNHKIANQRPSSSQEFISAWRLAKSNDSLTRYQILSSWQTPNLRKPNLGNVSAQVIMGNNDARSCRRQGKRKKG